MAEIIKIDKILRVIQTEDPSCLAVHVILEGELEECVHYLRDDDEYGNSPFLRQWVADNNPAILPYIPPVPEPEPIPDEVSRRQFFQQLAAMEIITKSEALAALTSGSIPAPLQGIIDQLPTEDDKFNAQMLVIGAQTFNRSHPLAEIVRQALQWTVEQKDIFWLEASRH